MSTCNMQTFSTDIYIAINIHGKMYKFALRGIGDHFFGDLTMADKTCYETTKTRQHTQLMIILFNLDDSGDCCCVRCRHLVFFIVVVVKSVRFRCSRIHVWFLSVANSHGVLSQRTSYVITNARWLRVGKPEVQLIASPIIWYTRTVV